MKDDWSDDYPDAVGETFIFEKRTETSMIGRFRSLKSNAPFLFYINNIYKDRDAVFKWIETKSITTTGTIAGLFSTTLTGWTPIIGNQDMMDRDGIGRNPDYANPAEPKKPYTLCYNQKQQDECDALERKRKRYKFN